MLGYDAAHFQPPAPVAKVTLRNPQNGNSVNDIVLLLDTGADITLLPQVAVGQLGIDLDNATRYELMGFDGSRSFALVVDLSLVLLGKVFRGRYLLIAEDHGILGRDILNHLSICLNGPAL